MTNPSAHIEEIRERRKESHSDVLDSLAGAIDRLEKAFPGQWHFLMEFIQNADDAGSTKLSLDISRDEIRVLNDGTPFDYDDVESICKVGRSSKTHTEKGEDYIGYLGVGFKSVFLISDNPQIYSGNYRFEFDKHAWDRPEDTPWQIYPLWIDNNSRDIANEGYTTGFRIPLSETVDDQMFDKLIEEVSAEQVSDRTLLFLRNLEEIEIKDRVRGKTKKLTKEKISQTPEYETYRFEIHEDGDLVETHDWLVFRSTSEIPPDVKDHQLTQRWERDNLNTREVMVGFRLNDNQELTKEQGTAHMGVFSFLPLKEVPSGLNFLVQADFLTAPGREAIHREAPWNEWLAEEVYELLRDQAIPVFKKDDRWKYNFTKILYPGGGGHEIFDEKIHQPLQNYLKSNPVLLDQHENFIKPENAIELGKYTESLIDSQDLQGIYPDKSVLHQNCETHSRIRRLTTDGPSYDASRWGIQNRLDEVLELKATEEDIEFFIKFYKQIDGFADSTLSGSPLKKQDIVLTQDNNLEAPNSILFPNPEVEIPPELHGRFNLVHEQLLNDKAKRTLKRLRVKQLTDEMVQNALNTEEIPNIRDNWDQFSSEQRIEKTQLCMSLWDNDQITASELDFLTLKSKDRDWVKPEDAVLSNEFDPKHNIEGLKRKGLISLDLSFLSEEYLADQDASDDWKRFFEALGIEADLPKGTISEQVATKTALEFERKNGRDPEELPHSEETGGYDIRSESYEGHRLIEAKGRRGASPSISLTPNQFERLQQEGDDYYIYVVRDTFKTPTLSVIEGPTIPSVEWSININFDKWHDLGNQEYHPMG